MTQKTKEVRQVKLSGTPFTLTYRHCSDSDTDDSQLGDVHSYGVVVYRNIRLDHFIEAQRTGKSLTEVGHLTMMRARFEKGRKAAKQSKIKLSTTKRAAPKELNEILADLGLTPKKTRKPRARANAQ